MRFMLGISIASLGLLVLPAQAQVTTPQTSPTAAAPARIADNQVAALVESLRLAAPNTGQQDNGLYTEWQILPDNIPRWSQQCLGRSLTPKEFESNPVTARNIVACIMGDVLQQEYQASKNNESVAVQRAASWWMTGDATRYEQTQAAGYTRKVLGFYQQLRSNPAAMPPAATLPQPVAQQAPASQTSQTASAAAPRTPTPSQPTTQQAPASQTSQTASAAAPRTPAPSQRATQQASTSRTVQTPAQPVQVANTQVAALVEALRQAAPKTGRQNDGLYSEWKVMSNNIPRWSKQCSGQTLTPKEFEANPQRARGILECVMRGVLGEQLRASSNNESVAVQRAASWWMTGDATRYQQAPTSSYTQRVLGFYQKLR